MIKHDNATIAARNTFRRRLRRHVFAIRLKLAADFALRAARKVGPIFTLIIGALLASWLGPVAVLRYQRLVSAREDATKQLDSAVLHVMTTEVVMRRYASELDAYWTFVLESQFRELELDKQRKSRSFDADDLEREQRRLETDLTEARERYHAAKDSYHKQAVAFRNADARSRLGPRTPIPSTSGPNQSHLRGGREARQVVLGKRRPT